MSGLRSRARYRRLDGRATLYQSYEASKAALTDSAAYPMHVASDQEFQALIADRLPVLCEHGERGLFSYAWTLSLEARMDNLEITVWSDLMSPSGQGGSLSREELLAWIRKPEVTANKKSLAGFALARFRDDRRSLTNVEVVSAVAIDDDKSGLSVEAIASKLGNHFAGVVFSTHSSTSAHPRTRTILFATRAMTSAEYPSVWAYVREHVHGVGLVIDENTKDPSRLWFVPAVRPDATFECAELGGALIDVDAIIASRPTQPVAHAKTYAGDVTDPDELAYRRDLYAAFLKKAAPCIQYQGGDTRLFEVVQHGAYDLALPTSDVLELVAQHFDPRCVPPWGDELTSRVAHKSHSAKTTSIRPRAEPMPRDLAHLTAVKAPVIVSFVDSDDDFHGITFGSWDVAIEPPEYLVDGLIPIETVGLLVAKGSSLKTWTVLSIAIAIVKGEPWLDRFVTKKTGVLIVDYESGDAELKLRIRLLENGIAKPFPNLGSMTFPADRIDEPEFWSRLARVCKAKGIGLIVIDSLAAGAPGTDENDARAATPMHLAGRFCEAAKAGVIFVHHSIKNDGGDDRDIVRGSGAIFNAADWAYRFVSGVETDRFRRVQMRSIKPCKGFKPPPVNLELTRDGRLRCYEEDDSGTAKELVSEPVTVVRNAILLALESCGSIPTKKKVRAAVGRKTDVVDPEIDVLLKTGAIVYIEGVGYQLDDDDRRRARVLGAMERETFASTAQLAKAAFTSTRFVDSLLRTAVIGRSVEGRLVGISQ